MSKLVRSVVLVAAMAGFVSINGSGSAQDPKGKATQPAAKDGMGKVEVYMAKDGWRWKVMNAEGKTVAMGTTGFEKQEDCLKMVELVKTTLGKSKVTVTEKAKEKEKDK